MTVTDRLNAMQQRCDAATEGPWEVRPETSQAQASVVLRGADSYPPPAEWIAECGPADCNGLPNAEFIAAARTDLPATIAAIRAVLDLHQPDVLGSSGCSPCCIGCEHGSEFGGSHVEFPCPTVRAITEALT